MTNRLLDGQTRKKRALPVILTRETMKLTASDSPRQDRASTHEGQLNRLVPAVLSNQDLESVMILVVVVEAPKGHAKVGALALRVSKA